jgi:hypothetical protein
MTMAVRYDPPRRYGVENTLAVVAREIGAIGGYNLARRQLHGMLGERMPHGRRRGAQAASHHW